METLEANGITDYDHEARRVSAHPYQPNPKACGEEYK
jgi:hypothetical protein